MKSKLVLLLADDDQDDCLFFKDALEELPVETDLTTVHNGEQLMELLSDENVEPPRPHVIFLDLNMPRKNGFECLAEIKADEKLRSIPVIIVSTSFDLDVVNLLYRKGAHYYIRKPADFSQLKNVIYQALLLASKETFEQPTPDDFVLQGFEVESKL
jgi:CheY-like chemotaxis protein